MNDTDYGLTDIKNYENIGVLDVKITGHDYDESKIACFLRLNVNVSSLLIESPSLTFLKQISEYLTDLSSLKLVNTDDASYHSNYDGALPIQLPKVTDLMADIIPTEFAFGPLQKVSVYSEREQIGEWFDYLKKNNGELTEFSINVNGLTESQLFAIPRIFPAVKIVHIHDILTTNQQLMQYSARTILRFMNKIEALVHFSIVFGCTEQEYHQLESEFKNNTNRFHLYWTFEATFDEDNNECSIQFDARKLGSRTNGVVESN